MQSANFVCLFFIFCLSPVVNRNLIGTGYMSTDQKKKLLWGNKKSTTAEEFGHHWDTALFSDRERQEKFNKLMGVKGELKVEHKPDNQEEKKARKIQKIHGSEGRTESGAQTRQPRKQRPPSREAEGTTTGFEKYTVGLRQRGG
ncbi:uncharacterized protein LOC114261121 [Camellia sinensis]|uniref:uncharacterized protein LOC114261121 n=1 Tax=Camellia sinensis TaxID=4442 RepID=UPI001036B3D4|nr:uncharacterized protein LOC114261121 [Camellia sinensis]